MTPQRRSREPPRCSQEAPRRPQEVPRTPKGRHFGSPKWYQNRTKIEVESEDEKKTLLKASWIDFGTFCKPRGKAKTMKFYWFCYDFMEIYVFDVQSVPRRQKGTVENYHLFRGNRLNRLSVGEVDSLRGGRRQRRGAPL